MARVEGIGVGTELLSSASEGDLTGEGDRWGWAAGVSGVRDDWGSWLQSPRWWCAKR